MEWQNQQISVFIILYQIIMQRLLFTSLYKFTIKLRGPTQQRKRSQFKNALPTKQDFFKQYYQNTRELYKNNFTAQQLKDSPDQVKKVLSLQNAAPSEILNFRVAEAVKKFQKNINDHGSSSVQCAVLSQRIIFMMIHVKKYTKDKAAIKSLTQLVNKRRNMLNYLMRTDFHRYRHCCLQYGIPQTFPKHAFHNKRMGYSENSWRGKYC